MVHSEVILPLIQSLPDCLKLINLIQYRSCNQYDTCKISYIANLFQEILLIRDVSILRWLVRWWLLWLWQEGGGVGCGEGGG